MNSSWRIGTAFGIGIFVHWSFLLLPAWVLYSNFGLGGMGLALYGLALLAAVFGCVVLHELGHALAARRFGIPTRDITLYPIGGVARLERMSEKPWEEFWIAIAGPAVNMLIASALFGALFIIGELAGVLVLPPIGLMFLRHAMLMNVLLATFNLLPVFPMDGGRVLRALLALRLGHFKATKLSVQIAMIMAPIIALVGILVFNNLMLAIVPIFVFLAGQQEMAAAFHRERQRLAEQDYGYLNEHYQPFVRSWSPICPTAPVFLWDEKTGKWVEQQPLRRV